MWWKMAKKKEPVAPKPELSIEQRVATIRALTQEGKRCVARLKEIHDEVTALGGIPSVCTGDTLHASYAGTYPSKHWDFSAQFFQSHDVNGTGA